MNKPLSSTTPRSLLTLGAVSALLMLAASLADILLSMALGGGMESHTSGARGRLELFQSSPQVFLYQLDLVNLLSALIMVPLFLSLCSLHARTSPTLIALSTAFFFLGTAAFIAVNPALPMAELAIQFGGAGPESQAAMAASAEALLARGGHGSLGALPAFLLPTLGNIVMSVAQLRGGFFKRLSPWSGILGHSALGLYLILVTFIPSVRPAVTAFAAPGGVLVLVWFITTAAGLIRLARKEG